MQRESAFLIKGYHQRVLVRLPLKCISVLRTKTQEGGLGGSYQVNSLADMYREVYEILIQSDPDFFS